MSSLRRVLPPVLALGVALGMLAALPAAAEPAGSVVTGRVTNLDGTPLDAGVQVRLYSYDPSGAFYPTPQDSELLLDGDDTFALEVPTPGYYAVQARPLTGTTHLTTWYGDAGIPTAASDPGSIFIDEEQFGQPLTDVDVALRRGVVVSGTATGSDGGPVADATVEFHEPDGDGLAAVPDVSGSLTGTNGGWRGVVPPGIDLVLTATRRGYQPWTLADPLDVEAGQDLTQDVSLVPDWSDTGSSGAVQHDETCLRRSVAGSAVLGGQTLHLSSTGVVGDVDTAGDERPLAEGSTRAELAPYWNGAAWGLTWGTSPDGSTLCALWRSPVGQIAYQLIATAPDPADPALEVTYNYGTVPLNAYVGSPVAGWSDGADDRTVLPGAGTDDGYADSTATGLVHGSRGSDVPGRYRFAFDGFGDPAAVVATAPRISPTTAGGTLVVDTGSWTVDGGSPDDLSFSYQWSRRGEPVAGATGPTLVTAAGDAGTPYSVQVTARRPGHRPARVTADTVVLAAPYLSAAMRPEVAGPVRAGSTLVATPGTWRGGVPTTTFAWSVGGRARGTGSTLTLGTGDVGQEVSLRVTARRAGVRDGAVTRRLGRVQPATARYGDLAVSVVDAEGEPVADARITACGRTSGACLDGVSGSGLPTGLALVGETYRVSVTPPGGSGVRGAAAIVTVPASGTAVLALTLRPVRPTPENVAVPSPWETVEDAPPLFWDESQVVEVTGCAAVAAPSYTLAPTDQSAARTAPLAVAEVLDGGLARYTATLPPPVGTRGHAEVVTNVPAACAAGTPGTSFDVYVDPYSAVLDQFGRPVPGAAVRLLRATERDGEYAVVESAEADGEGWFGWAPDEGWYVVEADAPGCTTGATPPVPVAPAWLNVTVRVTCAGVTPPAPSTPPTVSGPARVGATLTASGGTWPGLDSGLVWLRGTTVVGTGSRYVVRPADAGHALRVRAAAVRPDILPDPERGDPISFEPVTAESSAVAVPAAPAATRTTIRRAPGTVRAGTRARLTVVVAGTRGVVPTGRVRITDGGRVVARVTLPRSRSTRARVVVRLPRLAVGRHRLRAHYVGSATAAASASTVVRLRVARRTA